ncbi:MAG: diadenylate cyclase [Kiritimatiellae bacterium]|nr:diadenylate cyclase [Kiritimatiellia bacterium]
MSEFLEHAGRICEFVWIYVSSIPWGSVVEVFILYLVIYAILKGAKGSRFGQALAGLGVLAALLFAFSYLFHFEVLTRIVQFLLLYIAVSSVVIFQPEIRRILMTVGAFGFFERPKHRPDGSVTPEYLVETILELAKIRMGALIALERGISLRSYEEAGIALDAIYSRELVQSIFTPPLPLHDGGMVLRNGRIASAHCIFPVSNHPDLIAHGMRHRAAVGLSEETDALVIIVSEESGAVSVAHNGRMIRLDGESRASSLLRWARKALPEDSRERGFLKYVTAPFQRLFARMTKGDRK